MKRLLAVAAVVVAVSAAIYIYRVRTPLTLSPKELHLRTAGPYYSGLPIGSDYRPTKEASVEVESDAAYVKRCTPRALTLGKTPAEVHFRKGEKPTGFIPVVTFQILESGEVTNVVLKQSSGIRDKDNLALQWVKETKYNNRPGCGIIESEVGVTIDF